MPHPVVEQYGGDCLDVCELRRNGLLDGKRYRLQGGIRWPKIATMIVDPTCLQITLNNGQHQTFSISWAKCFTRSERPWLVCNHCGQRYARLYRDFGGYACRQCLDVWYSCQTVSTRRRQTKRLAKICAAIDGQSWRYTNSTRIAFPKRPAGMHRSRYYRICGRAADIETKLVGARTDEFGTVRNCH